MTELNETSISMEPIYQGRVIKVELHEILLANGHPARRELVRHPGAVAIVPIDADGNVLLVEQFRFAARRALLEIPAGTLELDEDPDMCAVRELREEIGYKPGTLHKLGGIFVAPGYTTEFIHLYHAMDLVEAPLDMDEDENIRTVRMPLTKAVRMIDAGEIIDGKTVTGILRVARLMGI